MASRSRLRMFNIYRLDAEAKGSTVFGIPEDVYKTRGR